MPLNFSTNVYAVCQDVFSVPCTFHPVFSQPEGASYDARGIYDTRQLDVMAEDGSILTDHRVILDILESEFAVLPLQHDIVTISADCNGVDQGDFEIVDAVKNGGGETTLTLRSLKSAG